MTHMKSNSFFSVASLLLAASILIFSCTSKTGDSTCSATPFGKWVKDASVAEYKIFVSGNGDTSVKQLYTAVTPNVIQQKNTYLNINPLTLDRNTIPFYFKVCGKDVFVHNSAYQIDQLVDAKNYYIKGTRDTSTRWEYNLNGVKYYCGCTRTNLVYNTSLGNLVGDKIYMRTTPGPSSCDTIIWSDSLGLIARYGGTTAAQTLLKKNF
jgi:hypothetical protein